MTLEQATDTQAKRVFVQKPSPADVYQDCASFHGRKEIAICDMLRLCRERTRKHHDIRI